MSEFDKYVAQWVSRAGDDLPKNAREKLLKNIKSNLSDYEVLRGPAASRAGKKKAEKKRLQEEEKAKEEARKERAEQDRRRQERQASLPPLPPSKSNTETALGVAAGAQDTAEPTKKAAAKKSGPAGGGSSSSNHHLRKATAKGSSWHDNGAPLDDKTSPRKRLRASQKIPYRKDGGSRSKKRSQAGPEQVKDIDFSFGKHVDAQLRQLETETPSTTAHNAARRRVKISPIVADTAPTPPASAAPPDEPAATAPAAPATQKAARKRSSQPPPLDQIVTDDAELAGSNAEAAAAAMASQGSFDEDSAGQSAPFFAATYNYHERLNAFQFASAGTEHNGKLGSRSDVPTDEDEEEVEEEFIDDHEDVRRRTMQMQRPSRPAISDSTLDIDEARIANFPTTPKSQNKVKTISRVLVRHFLFSTLDDNDIAKVASVMDLERFEAGENVLTKGEPNDTFYIVLDGEAETTEVNEAGEEVVVPLIRGSTCGDVALMYELRNDATVVARTALQCASLQRRTYKMITSRAMEEKRRKYIDFLASIPLFDGLSASELERVAESLKEDTYVEGQKVITYGVPNHWLHIVMEGTLRVMAPDVNGAEEREVSVVQRGHFVGEIEFIYHHLPVASVYADSPVVKTAKLSRRSFEVLPRGVREKLVRLVEEDATYNPYHMRMRSSSPPAFDMTPHFDAPPPSVQKSLRQYESEQSEGTSAATDPLHPSQSTEDAHTA
ncbi:regulatory subunit of protein kinase a-like protein [Leptomonas pyrrhocoris]|uniref:Regulatory subunit of protein kinase a-like protein n=1 Tax=Leptomonas pyrrhocoris TaxID=157538 RepID=A0A0M9G4Z7_LEPPY|nr:regulatory subunit of protein kinase a-like protein [Leptomonas pyrrhocoris]KPA82357.1 regulatory subunit of protein kinase a-like protein [Leptomonas pyrrhocoris]|eukprot:XP_015660796.1 regulatory subunit of protein kinase a-like protein [Leptomonas pyrrhocoris]